MSRFSNIVLIGVSLFTLLQSCKEIRCDDPIPNIDFESFEQLGDTAARLILNFKDCDGDIGLTQEDTAAPYDYNLFLEYFEKQNGNWVHIEPRFPFYYRIPLLEGYTPYDLKEGQIILDMGIYYNVTSPYDTIKYEIKLRDRSLNESNSTETDEIVVS